MMEWTDRHCRFFHRLLTRRALLYTEMITTGAVLRGDRLGLSDNWLRHIQDVRQKHEKTLADAGGEASDRLCELNVIQQVANVRDTTIARDAWERGQELAVHGWIYGLHDGLLRDLNVTRDKPA